MSKTTIKVGGYKTSFSTHRQHHIGSLSLSLPNYKQQDYYSCGFLAALTVVRYYYPLVDTKEVLWLVQPIENYGTSCDRIKRSLRQLGITATYHDDLMVADLALLVRDGIPVIITVWPYTWSVDHWVVVRGFYKGRVYLTNHYSMRESEFISEWIDNWEDGSITGAGLVCERSK